MGSRTIDNWVAFLPEFLDGRACQWYERQPEVVKESWDRLNIGLITKFSKKNLCETLICELSQMKQEILENVKDYIDRV